MADTASSPPADETPNQKLARERREKRAKKMAEQGEDRLNRIKALNGGLAPPEEVLGGPDGSADKAPPAATVADDPEEVDISQHGSGFGTPSNQTRGAAGNTGGDPFAAAMLRMQQQQQQNQTGGEQEDPMVKMMQQMMGMMGGDPNNPDAPPPDVPPMLKALLGATNPSAQTPADTAPPPVGTAYAWRITHAVVSVLLATYIALTSTFNGSQLSRTQSAYGADEAGDYGFGRRLFLMFCTAELVLQSSRYFADKGKLQGTGIFATVANSGFLPEPWAGYVRITGRYVGIVRTIVADAMVVVFVFGVMAWWKGLAVA